ncbi:MAG: hypothetical protein EXR12_11735 [Rhodospirillaceae bacterium]|nr:hypothetical protein [Rhodospirillaceae bacterium]
MLPTDLASFLDLIRLHGETTYGFIFAYALLHALLLAMFAGYAAHAGALGVGQVIVICWAGSFVGDVVRFWIGRRFGTRWLRSRPRLERGAQTVARLAGRHHLWMIMIHRYPYGVRGIAAVVYGMSPLPWPKFLILNFVAAGLWSVVTVSAGYIFGYVSEKTLTNASSGFGVAMLVAFLGLAWLLSRKLGSALERD